MNSLSRHISDSKLGMLTGILSSIGFGLTSVIIHRATSLLPASEIAFGRAALCMFILLPFAWKNRKTWHARGSAMILLRAVAGALSILCFSWNLQHTSVGVANMLFNLSLLLVLFAGIVSGEATFSVRALAEVTLIACGVLVYWHGSDVTISASVGLVGVVGALAATIAYTALKKASRTSDPWSINFAVCAGMMLISPLVGTRDWVAPNGKALVVLLAVAIGSLASQLLLVASFRRLPLPLATALTTSCVIWGVLMDELFGGARSIDNILGAIIYGIGICALSARTATSPAAGTDAKASPSSATSNPVAP